ncbi:hypothetical protein HNQ94_000265 [Salirhabdus euzebyi]|uniref:Uncharacterized protein n=1 Tax=Salirhabdus euzebyi TaxID=394506 RepID=A0A841PVS3_9BACI|nr:hypothetical protein [Salirhabdus euzebyi]MBB6451844.1 hypothetical protein [Salirhabdus euzebyi]
MHQVSYGHHMTHMAQHHHLGLLNTVQDCATTCEHMTQKRKHSK